MIDILSSFVEWAVVVNGVKWLLTLGVFSAIVTAVITSARERTSRDRNHRATLGREFVRALITSLSSRLSPSSPADAHHDAEFVYSYQTLITEMSGWRDRRLRRWVENAVREVRFGHPRPSIDDAVAEVAPLVACWVRKPRKARKLVRCVDSKAVFNVSPGVAMID